MCGRGWRCTRLEHPLLFDQLLLDLQCHLLIDSLCDVGQVIYGDERVEFCFFLQGARVYELEGVCVNEVWQDFLDQLEAQVESRRGFPRIRIATDVVPQQA